MSYSYTIPGLGSDVNLGFGPLPGALTRDRVANATCLEERPCICFAPLAPVTNQTNAVGTGVLFRWAGSPDALFFETRTRESGGVWSSVRRVEGFSTLYDNVPTAQMMEYEVRAVCNEANPRRESEWSRNYYTSRNNKRYCNENEPRNFTGSVLISDGSGNLNYESYTTCSWQYSSENGFPILIEFLDFRTELNFDGVVIHDGVPDEGAEASGEFSGRRLPPKLVAYSGTVHIIFESVLTNEGWTIRLSELSSPVKACKGLEVRTAAVDTLSDGSGERDYEANADCRWLLSPNGANNVSLEFISFKGTKLPEQHP